MPFFEMLSYSKEERELLSTYVILRTILGAKRKKKLSQSIPLSVLDLKDQNVYRLVT